MSRRSETLTGTTVSPADIIAAGLIGTVRRVVLGAASVVIDLGRQRRFVRAARHALLLRDRHCAHPGCTVPAAHTQGDHTVDYAKGGLTNPTNGGLLCPRHNRLRNHGYQTVRDQLGHWHTHRPDGTEIGRPLITT